jgi:hypothetical protein
MKYLKRVVVLLVIASIAGASYWAFRWLAPSPEQRQAAREIESTYHEFLAAIAARDWTRATGRMDAASAEEFHREIYDLVSTKSSLGVLSDVAGAERHGPAASNEAVEDETRDARRRDELASDLPRHVGEWKRRIDQISVDPNLRHAQAIETIEHQDGPHRRKLRFVRADDRWRIAAFE